MFVILIPCSTNVASSNEGGGVVKTFMACLSAAGKLGSPVVENIDVRLSNLFHALSP